MHKKTKGSVAELAVALRLMKEGWQVLIPYGENTRYDLVVERDGRFLRVQIKYVTPKDGVLRVNCRSSNNWSVFQYTSEDIDVIAAYDAQSEQSYFVPVAQLRKGAIRLRPLPPKNHQTHQVRFAREFGELRDAPGSYLFHSSEMRSSKVL